MRTRTQVGVGLGLFVLLLALGFAWIASSQPPTRCIAGDAEQALDAPGAPAGRAGRAPAPAPAPARAEKPSPSVDRDRTPEARPSPRAASLVEQLVALHAIESQAALSAYLQRNAEIAAATIDEYCAAAAPLARPPETSRLRDASPYLNPRVDWAEPVRQGALHLSEERLARTTGEAWLTTITPADLPQDVSWMGELAAFDHWSVPPRARVPDEPYVDVVEIPNYLQLRAWARLRWARALTAGDLLETSRDVNHLAALLRSQGLIIAVMISLALQQDERVAFEAATARGLVVPGWEPASAETLALSRRLDRAGFAFLAPGVDPAVTQRALSCIPTPCAAVMEGAWSHATIGEFAPDNTSAAFWALAEPYAACSPGLLTQIRAATEIPPERARAMFDVENPLEKAFPRPTR